MGWRLLVDNEVSWTLFFKMGEFQWTFSESEFSWTLLVNSRGQKSLSILITLIVFYLVGLANETSGHDQTIVNLPYFFWRLLQTDISILSKIIIRIYQDSKLLVAVVYFAKASVWTVLAEQQSTIDFCPRPARKETKLPLHRIREAKSLLS